jgi:type III pantothenate kinase
MLLVINANNTNMAFGLYDEETLREKWSLPTAAYTTSDELRVRLSILLQNAEIAPNDITGCCIASVVPHLNRALIGMCEDTFTFKPIIVEPGVKTGLKLNVENPKEVGADRIANSIGALQDYDPPLVIVDLGTATTFDVITKDGQWCGGAIVPGIQLSADALFNRCAKLPQVELTVPQKVIGRNTLDNIRSGLTYGYAELVDGLIRRIAEEMDATPTVIATGGLAPLIAPITNKIDAVDPLLTIKGLKAIYAKNGPDA